MSDYRLSDLLDLAVVQKMADAHYRAAGMPIGIVDAIDGSVLVGSGWQDICVKFHRSNPATLQRCRASDNYIKDHLVEGEACRYKCQNGLWDIGLPIMVNGCHLATMFLGQFFYEGEVPDREFFGKQAREYGFDVDAYLAALDRVPVLTREKVETILEYDKALVSFIADLAEHAVSKIKAHETIRANERKYHALFDQAYQFLGVLSIDGRILEANRTALGLGGVEGVDVIGRPFWETPWWAHSPGLQEKVRRAVQQAAKGEFVRFEATHPASDGILHYVDFSFKPVTDEAGDIALLISEGRDITMLRQAEESLCKSEERMRLFFERQLVGMAITSPEKRWLQVNDKLCAMLGYSREELMRLTWSDITYPEDLTPDVAQFDRLLAGEIEKYSGEKRFVRKDGTVVFTSLSVGCVRRVDGAVDYVLTLLEDITERKRAQEALQKINRLQSVILDNSSVGIAFVRNRIFEWVNPRMLELFGMPREQLQGASTRLIYAGNQTYDQLGMEAYPLLAEGKKASFEVEMRKGDGSLFWCRFEGNALDASKPHDGSIWIMEDITEEKQAEKEHLAHLHFLQCMDRVNQAIQGSNDLEKMMSSVLEIMLSVFDSDRAWLVYPCDPEAASWQVPMERSRPEYPGALEMGLDVPMDPDVVKVFQTMRASHGPVTFGPGSDQPLVGEVPERFQEQSQIAMTLYPKVDKPWLFGMHQCSYPRIWTEEEKRLLQEIGLRLEPVLTSLLVYRNLRESEEKYRTLIQKIQAAVVVHGADTQIITSNPTAQDLLGFTEDQLVGKTVMDPAWHFLLEDGTVMPPEKYPVNQVLSTRQALRNFIAGVGRSGKQENDVWVLVNADPVFGKEDEITQVIVTFIDITKRKRAEEEAQHLRNYLSNIINSMPSVLVGVDVNGCVTHWNAAAEETTGVRAVDAHGQLIDQVLPAMGRQLEKLRQAMRTRTVETEAKVARTVNGEVRYEDVTVYPLMSNGVEGAVIRVDDVTERVRIEEMMVQSEKMLSIGGLAAGMAHEINNPLGVILQAVQNVFRRVSPALPANVRVAEECGISLSGLRRYFERRAVLSFLEDIRQSGQRAAEIVANMLSFSRKAEGEGSAVDMAELLDRTVVLAASDYDLKKHYDFRQIEIVRDYDPDVPEVVCQPGKIQQVFLNILRNGAEAMMATQASGRAPQFTLRIGREAGMVRIEIEDNGAGMDDATRRRVFEPFFTTKPPGLGTGLGLSVSYFIITEDHGGSMSVESQGGIGTRFVIRLRVAGREP